MAVGMTRKRTKEIARDMLEVNDWLQAASELRSRKNATKELDADSLKAAEMLEFAASLEVVVTSCEISRNKTEDTLEQTKSLAEE